MGSADEASEPTPSYREGIEYAEQVLESIAGLYEDSRRGKEEVASRGLESIAKELNLSILRPRQKVTVLLLGNHSAGKSSFVNWYTEFKAQSTGVAVESKGFTVVTHGKRHSATLQGSGTIKYLPSLASLQSVPGVLAHLETKVSVHEARDFRMIDFIDTPGLVDGNVEYPFDVQKALLALAGVADVVLVFLDPMGQALCSRTMHAVRELEKRHASKMRYYLTKVDAVSNLNDLLKVSNQMIQNLSKYLSNTHGFQLSPIFLPPAASGVDPAVQRVNRIDELCDELSGAIPQKVQNNMHIAAQHASLVFGAAEQQLRSAQRRDTLRAYLGLLQLALGAALMAPLALLSAYHVLPLAVGTDPWTETVTVALDVAVDTGAAVLVYPLAGEVEGVRRRVLAWLIVLALLAVFGRVSSWLHPPPGRESSRLLALRNRARKLHAARQDIYEQFFSDSLHMEGQAEEPAREEAAKGE